MLQVVAQKSFNGNNTMQKKSKGNLTFLPLPMRKDKRRKDKKLVVLL